MENKILTQELNLIDELLQMVNTKEEYDYLVARAKEICPGWLAPDEKDNELSSFALIFSSLMKGGEC